MTHQLGKPVPDAFEAFEVYKDYDGNAPDTDGLVVCADRQLATEVARWCHDNERLFSLPFVDGWEHCASYRVRPTIARVGGIATTIEQAQAQLGYEQHEYPLLDKLVQSLAEAGVDPKSYEITEETSDCLPSVVLGDMTAIPDEDGEKDVLVVYHDLERGSVVVLTTEDPCEVRDLLLKHLAG